MKRITICGCFTEKCIALLAERKKLLTTIDKQDTRAQWERMREIDRDIASMVANSYEQPDTEDNQKGEVCQLRPVS